MFTNLMVYSQRKLDVGYKWLRRRKYHPIGHASELHTETLGNRAVLDVTIEVN